MDTESDSSPTEESFSEKNLFERVKSLFGFRGSPDTTEELESEIQELLEEGEEQGLISSEEEQLISSIFDFRDTTASEIMTPSAEMVSADENVTIEELVRLINEERYTRIPIYRKTNDNIIGFLHAKDLLRIWPGTTDTTAEVTDLLNPPTLIPESKPITELLREFQEKKNHMAFVVDEFAGVRGLITLEDVIEEIVGEIDDEHDQNEIELRIIDDHTIIVNAKIDVEEVEAHFSVTLPEGPYESIGGFIIHQLGHLPDPGALVASDLLTFKVIGADKRRIKTVEVTRHEVPDADS